MIIGKIRDKVIYKEKTLLQIFIFKWIKKYHPTDQKKNIVKIL